MIGLLLNVVNGLQGLYLMFSLGQCFSSYAPWHISVSTSKHSDILHWISGWTSSLKVWEPLLYGASIIFSGGGEFFSEPPSIWIRPLKPAQERNQRHNQGILLSFNCHHYSAITIKLRSRLMIAAVQNLANSNIYHAIQN